jgi:hypothetical protein
MNKVKLMRDSQVVAEIKMQAAPLCLEFYLFNHKDFMIVSGV